jgi:membrane-associated phospholipid phosphatase
MIFIRLSLVIFLLFNILPQAVFAQKSGVETAGDILQYALPIAAGTSTLIWKSNDKPLWQFCKSFGTSFVVTHSLKRIINKERPNGGEHSFPSGHTTAAFSGAAFLQMRYGWKVGAPAYALASFVGWSRVYSNNHDYWDVLGGAVVGVGSAYLFTKKYQKGENIALTFNRQYGVSTLGLAMTF